MPVESRSLRVARTGLMLVRLVAFIFSFCFWASSHSQAAERFVMADAHPRIMLNKRVANEIDISSYLEVLHDPSGELNLQQVMAMDREFVRDVAGGLRTRLGNNVYWVRGKISRSLSDPVEDDDWLILVESTLVQKAQLFLPEKQWESPVAGLAVANQQRYFQDRYPVFPLGLSDANTLTFYLRIQTDGVSTIPIKIWKQAAYYTDQRMRLPMWGLFFGGLMALMLYNLFIYFSLREPAYWHLTLFLFVMVIVTSMREGFFSLFITGNAPWFNMRMDNSALLMGLSVSVYFTRSFLATQKEYNSIDRILQVGQWLSLALAVLNFAYPLGSWIMQTFFMTMVLTLAICAIAASMHASDQATRYFVAGWSLLFTSYIIFQLSQLGLLPVNQFTTHGKSVALSLLGVLLSLGLAAQIRHLRYEKQRALIRQQETVLELKYSEDQLQKKVLRDTLMEFPGLDTLKYALSEAAYSSHTKQPLVLVLLELHHLNTIELQLGHSVRDELLTRATKRLTVILRGVSGVLPLGGQSSRYIPMAVLDDGSYGFVLRGMPDETINSAIEEVERAMSRPFFYQGIALQPGISFGLARLGDQCENAESMWLHAQLSLHADLTKNLSKPYEMGDLDHHNSHNIVLINELRSAVHEDQISLYFQPVYDLHQQYVCGVEVFSRWESFVGEKVSPNEIFYLAEVGGFVADLTLRVVDKALRYFVAAVDLQEDKLKLSINLSPKCLRDEHFIDEVVMLLVKHRLPAQWLSFEIKEAAIIEDPSINAEVLNRIRTEGIGLTIDEFGNAYSNPSYLSSIPVTEVKLDQRFVARLDEPEVITMLHGLIDLCADQNVKLVVHGVEDASTLQRLSAEGCLFAQGHYLAAPVLAREFKLKKDWFNPIQFPRTRSHV